MAEIIPSDQPTERYTTVLSPLAGLTDALDRHSEAISVGSWRPTSGELTGMFQQLAEQVMAAREAVEALQQAQRDERHRRNHEMRSALNAIAGWVHILRLEPNATPAVARAADVFDRNVRVLTKLIDSNDG